LKHKVKSKSGIGSIPDGYVIMLGNTSQWHIVEVELSSHPLHDHIVSQIGRFVSAIKNPNTQAEIVSTIYDEIAGDTILVARMRKIIGSNEIYKYLTDCISTLPTVTIIIEKATPELDEALEAINHPIKKVVEFRTLVRENADTVHVHLFEPLYRIISAWKTETSTNGANSKLVLETKPKVIGKGIDIRDLLDSGIVKPNQTIYKEYNGEKYEAIINANGMIILKGSDKQFKSLSTAASSCIGNNVTWNQVNGWTWWNTLDKDGKEIMLDNLREEHRQKRS
jgi:hypothetical protein